MGGEEKGAEREGGAGDAQPETALEKVKRLSQAAMQAAREVQQKKMAWAETDSDVRVLNHVLATKKRVKGLREREREKERKG